MSGNLYQLWSQYKKYPGQDFEINGPYDKNGRVLKFIRKDKRAHNNDGESGHPGRYLYLILGEGA